MIVVALLHGIGNFAAPPADAALDAVLEAMRGYKFDMGFGMRPSFLDINQSLSLTTSILLMFVATQNLVIASLVADGSPLVGRLCLVNVLFVGVLVGLFAAFRITPPLLTFGVVEILFLLGLIPRRKRLAESPT